MKRRQFIRISSGGGFALAIPGKFLLPKDLFLPLAAGLNDPSGESLFTNEVPNALNPGFIYQPPGKGPRRFRVGVHPFDHDMGFANGALTKMFGYGESAKTASYPGKTFVEYRDIPTTVRWQNNLQREKHLVPYDSSLHWAYSLQGYNRYSIEKDGIPIVPHVHGGHTEFESDGNPEYFFSPGYSVRGPQWVKKDYQYANDQAAGTIWYHDHALGITRLNVYAGMAGFYIIRDANDTGLAGNSLDLPVYPYEAAFAIQDKMFNQDGSLFYPAFPGDPFYDDFITGEGAILPVQQFPGGGPTALAEFFGDHMMVNGKLWPKMEVEPRNYRLRFLNGCDSRFLVTEFYAVSLNDTQVPAFSDPLKFTVIGSDQGLVNQPKEVTRLVMETGSRYDLIFNFEGMQGKRIIMKNIAGDTPFGFAYGDDLEPGDIFGTPSDPRRTDRIMAFDVTLASGDLGGPADLWNVHADFSSFGPNVPVGVDRVRKVALFEGTDEFGRLQPILGTAEPATDYQGNPILWPNTPPYASAGLAGQQIEGAVAWHSPTTENPALNSVEEWQIFNVTGDSHPIHLHLVHFEVVRREKIKWDSNAIDGLIPASTIPQGDGTYLELQTTVQHNSGDTGLFGSAYRIVNPTSTGEVLDMTLEPEYVENAPKDMVTCRPGEITVIRAKFDKPGRYVWHCHILSHEDHEMMRVLHVGPDPESMANLRTDTAPEQIATAENYPNPFTSETNFRVDLKEPGEMEVVVFSQSGKKIQSVGRGLYDRGVHTISWNGMTMNGAPLAPGLYFYYVSVKGRVAHSGKLIKR